MSTIDTISYTAGTFRSTLHRFFRPVYEDRAAVAAFYVLLSFVILAFVVPYLPIPGPYEPVQAPDGSYVGMTPPSQQFVLGTTFLGYSVLSQTLYSLRVSLFVGAGAAFLVIFIGMNIGLVSGYYGGRIDTLLMGLTDLVYGLPLYPIAIIFVAVVGTGTLSITLIIGLLLWRVIARMTRSEVWTLKERGFIKSAKASGSSDLKIMYFHIFPNLIPLLVVYLVFGATWGVLLEASLSFIGLGDPNAISWGQMLHGAFNRGVFTEAWWWVIPPGLSLWLFIWCMFTVARSLERNVEIEVEHRA